MKKSLLIVLALALMATVFVSCSNEPKKVTVTFIPGDATGQTYTQAIPAGVATKLEKNRFENAGYAFNGWSLSPTGGNDYPDEGSVIFAADTNLYAVWTKIYSITGGEATGGKLIPEKVSYIERDEIQSVKMIIEHDEDHYLSGVSFAGSKNTQAFFFLTRLYVPAGSSGDIVMTPTFEEKPATVSYLSVEWDAEKSEVVETIMTVESKDYALVKSSTKNLNKGIYVVVSDVEIDSRMTVSGDVTLIILDGKALKADKGITVPEGAKLSIFGQGNGTGKLIIDNNDLDGHAGLGGDDNSDCGEIVIGGGIITAEGGLNGAGIGGGASRKAGTVTILKGTVDARGGESGAGIGGGLNADGGTINIYGGTVDATGAANGAGIGGGNCGAGGTILLAGGTIKATNSTEGLRGGAGIGGGNTGKGGDITISGATIEAHGGDGGAGIGAGVGGEDGGKVTITGGDVKSTGGRGAAGIGGGWRGSGADVTINGGKIDITGGKGNVDVDVPWHNSAIGKGYHSGSAVEDKTLVLGEGVSLVTQGKDETEWKPWDGESRPFKMKTN